MIYFHHIYERKKNMEDITTMLTFAMGEAIRSMRIRAGYTQEELSFGICAVSTLSRIENGRENASKQVFEALASRMMGIDYFGVSYESEKEMECSKLHRKILLLLEQRRLGEVKNSIEKYLELLETDNKFCMQFILYTKAVYLAILQGEKEEILDNLYKALNLTMLDLSRIFQDNEKRRILLTYNEIYILNNIGIQYEKGEDNLRALEVFNRLRKYVERRELDKTDSVSIYAMIISNLAGILEKIGQFQEAAELCNTGIDACQAIGRYTVLPYLLCIKARCCAALGNYEISEKSKMQAQTLLDIGENYKGFGSFGEFYEAKEPIYVTF